MKYNERNPIKSAIGLNAFIISSDCKKKKSNEKMKIGSMIKMVLIHIAAIIVKNITGRKIKIIKVDITLTVP